jgi:Protein of unknown function (DUF2934)
VSTPKKSRPILRANRGKIVAPAEPPSNAAPPAADESMRREVRIAVAAYFLAERRNFRPGGELADWLAAEREIDATQRAADSSAASG